MLPKQIAVRGNEERENETGRRLQHHLIKLHSRVVAIHVCTRTGLQCNICMHPYFNGSAMSGRKGGEEGEKETDRQTDEQTCGQLQLRYGTLTIFLCLGNYIPDRSKCTYTHAHQPYSTHPYLPMSPNSSTAREKERDKQLYLGGGTLNSSYTAKS